MDPFLASLYHQDKTAQATGPSDEGVGTMNVTMNVECTPEEARRMMGLPDMSSVHEVYLEKIRRTIDEGVTPESIETLMRSWAPMGEASMSMWRQLFEQMSGGALRK